MSAEETWTYRVGPEDGATNLVQINIADGKASPVGAGPGVKEYPSVLPSGEVAYVRRQSPVQGVFYASGKAGPAGSDVRSPSWSPDGAHVVYSRYTTKRTAEPVKVWTRNPKYELSTTAFLPAYDPAGERLAVTMVSPSQTTNLFIVDEGKPAHSILERKELILAPQWSPDGRQIIFGVGAFTSFLDFAAGGKKPIDPVNGGAQVGMINADGSEFHLITSGPNNNAFASFAPDGKQIIYRTAGPEGEGLRIMNLEDHSVTVLTSKYDNFPAWSPRGDLIAFIRKIDGNFEVFTIRPDGKDLRQLTNTPGNEAHLAWSPDGQRLAFASTRMGFKDEALYSGAPQPYGEIFVMRYDGTQTRATHRQPVGRRRARMATSTQDFDRLDSRVEVKFPLFSTRKLIRGVLTSSIDKSSCVGKNMFQNITFFGGSTWRIRLLASRNFRRERSSSTRPFPRARRPSGSANRTFLPSSMNAARDAPARLLASSTAPLRIACIGRRTKTTPRLAASSSIPCSASAANCAPAKAPTARSWKAARGTPSTWFRSPTLKARMALFRSEDALTVFQVLNLGFRFGPGFSGAALLRVLQGCGFSAPAAAIDSARW